MAEKDTTSPKTTDATRPAPAWAALHLWQMQPVRDVLLGLGLFALIIIGQKTSVVTVPLLLAILLAYLFEPVIVWMMNRFGSSRRVSVITIMVSVIFFVIIPVFGGGVYAVGQLVNFTTNTINDIDRVSNAIEAPNPQIARQKLTGQFDPSEPNEVFEEPISSPWLWVYDTIQSSRKPDAPAAGSADSDAVVQAPNEDGAVEELGSALDAVIQWISDNREQVASTTASAGVDLVNRILNLLGAAFGISFMVFVTVFFFFFTATEWVQLKGFGTKLLPDKNRDRIIDLLHKFDAVISGFIRGRITIAFIQGIVFSIGYFIIGVPGAFILGPVVAVLSVVPYLALIGLPISVSLLALQGHDGFRGEWWWILAAPAAIYFIGQALDDYVWTPLIQGKSTGMDTPTILFASLAGGALFGIFGLLIAIPIAACVKILIQEIFWPRFKEWAEGRANDPLPIE
jgi:predicted PurR-regulated permease PerM